MGLVIHKELITPELGKKLAQLCPFGAISYGTELDIGMGCKLCKLCVKNSGGVITFQEEDTPSVDKNVWKDVVVFVEHYHGKIHPVTYELLGKAKELAAVTGQKVLALMMGSDILSAASGLARYGAEKVYVYDDPLLKDFLVEPYADAFSHFVETVHPSSILVGATNVGRSLAPRVAARFHTGLTADCTHLEMMPDTDLVQVRPAFGGNIMAMIKTPRTRPQFCTVRYKIFDVPEPVESNKAEVNRLEMPLISVLRARVLSIEEKPVEVDISEADVIVQVGRGVKSHSDLAMIEQLADLLGARIACTRPLVENAWYGPKQQIGLSGRTVKPKLLICIGVSGAVQTVAGMKGSGCIVAINKDPAAPIFDVAHFGLVGDLYQVIPELITLLAGRKECSDQ